MKAAALVFLAAAMLAAALALGLVQFGSHSRPPPAIALHGSNVGSFVPARQPSGNGLARTEVRQRVEEATLFAYPAPGRSRARR
jgi:hypothetical protein